MRIFWCAIRDNEITVHFSFTADHFALDHSALPRCQRGAGARYLRLIRSTAILENCISFDAILHIDQLGIAINPVNFYFYHRPDLIMKINKMDEFLNELRVFMQQHERTAERQFWMSLALGATAIVVAIIVGGKAPWVDLRDWLRSFCSCPSRAQTSTERETSTEQETSTNQQQPKTCRARFIGWLLTFCRKMSTSTSTTSEP